MLTADIGYRRGKAVDLKGIVDEAIAGLDYVEKVVGRVDAGSVGRSHGHYRENEH